MSGPWGPLLSCPDHILVIGVPQSGKTTHAKRLAATAPRVVYFDPSGDYEDVRGRTLVTVQRWPGREFTQRTHFRIVVRAGRSPHVDVADEFVYVAERVREIGPVVLLADEVGDYNKGPAERALKGLHRNGHHDGVVTLYVSQRAVDIPLGCRATATEVRSFLQDNEDDLDALRKAYDPGHPGYAAKVRAWEPGQRPVIWRRKKLYG